MMPSQVSSYTVQNRHTVVWEKIDVKSFSSLVWHNENWTHKIFLTMNKYVGNVFYSLETPRDKNIIQTNFTWKYPMVNFSKLRYLFTLILMKWYLFNIIIHRILWFFSHKYNFDWASKNEPSWHKIHLIMKCKII